MSNLESKHMDNNVTYPKATLVGEELIFDTPTGFDEGLREGFFYVKMPDDFDSDAATKFATEYYLEKNGSQSDDYRGYRDVDFNDSILGYSNPNDQVEFLQLESNLWDKYFPERVSGFLHQMNTVSKLIMNAVFQEVGVKSEDLQKITGGMDEDKALHYCIFNHYRSVKDDIGFTAHKDSGFITILYGFESGLEGHKNGEWFPIDPIPGYFTVNMGHSLEVLTAKMQKPVHAIYHRVKQTHNRSQDLPDRFSVGAYIGPRFNMDLYQYDETNQLHFFKSFIDFQKEKAREMNYEFHPKVA